MTDSTQPQPDSPAEPTQPVTNVSGVNLDAQRDVVGRDKIMQAGDDIVLGDQMAIAKLNDQNASKKYSIEPRLEGDLRQALRGRPVSSAREWRARRS